MVGGRRVSTQEVKDDSSARSAPPVLGVSIREHDFAENKEQSALTPEQQQLEKKGNSLWDKLRRDVHDKQSEMKYSASWKSEASKTKSLGGASHCIRVAGIGKWMAMLALVAIAVMVIPALNDDGSARDLWPKDFNSEKVRRGGGVRVGGV
jgi:hypothetical protein